MHTVEAILDAVHQNWRTICSFFLLPLLLLDRTVLEPTLVVVKTHRVASKRRNKAPRRNPPPHRGKQLPASCAELRQRHGIITRLRDIQHATLHHDIMMLRLTTSVTTNVRLLTMLCVCQFMETKKTASVHILHKD